MYPNTSTDATPYSDKLIFTVDVQGRVFKVKLAPTVKRQSKRSVVDDWRAWQDARYDGKKRCYKYANTVAPHFKEALYALAEGERGREVDLYATERLLNSKQVMPTRGKIYEFSRKSRSRLIEKAARLRAASGGVFITLTYRENMQDAALAKTHLDKVLRWLKYHKPFGAFIWRMEYQKRGAIHFHILALNVHFVDAEELTVYWQVLTADDSYPDVKAIRSQRRVLYYVSKYLAKTEQADKAGGDCGFISLPYLDNYTGRFWGVTNRKRLPLAPQTVVQVSNGDGRLFFDLKRYARRYWRGLSRRLQGFTLYAGNSARWLELLYAMLSSSEYESALDTG